MRGGKKRGFSKKLRFLPQWGEQNVFDFVPRDARRAAFAASVAGRRPMFGVGLRLAAKLDEPVVNFFLRPIRQTQRKRPLAGEMRQFIAAERGRRVECFV